jgi:hypothetical protein
LHTRIGENDIGTAAINDGIEVETLLTNVAYSYMVQIPFMLETNNTKSRLS